MTVSVDRSQLRLIIAGLTEGVVIIEPDESVSWANAAALAMHGVEDLDDLGRTVAAYRANFVLRYRNNIKLEDERYPIERVIAGEAFDDVVVEVTPARNPDIKWVHRIRSLVLTDRKGKPDFLVLVITDATERFAAEDRFERTFAANPAPAIICRLSDLRFIKVNQGFLDMTGYDRHHLLGRSTYEIDLFASAERRTLAVERLSEGRTIPQMEARLPLPNGSDRFVIVAGQPIDMDEEPCMLFTFADLELRRKAETALQQSEERFEKAFRLSPVPTVLVRLKDLAYVAINDVFTETFGFTDEDVRGRTVHELNMWAAAEVQAGFHAALHATGHVHAMEACLVTKDGSHLDCMVAAETMTINTEPCVLATLLDISARKHTERELMAAIDAVMADTSWFSRGVIQRLAALRHPNRNDPDALLALTAREREVLGLMCDGASDAVIAKRLTMSVNTVRNHTSALYRKTKVHRRSELVIWGREHGFPFRS